MRSLKPGATDINGIDLPTGFVERMTRELGEKAFPFFAAISAPEEGLRANTLRLAPQRLAGMVPFELIPWPLLPEGFLVPAGSRPASHSYHAAGLYYLQDPGAMLVADVVDALPGERVLDLAAAPGGKATHIAARMRNKGVLVANDVSRTRAWETVGNFERCGVTNGVVTSESTARLAAQLPGYFDRVLVDAPCSGESMFHKSSAARDSWSDAAVAGCARRQAGILGDAASLVRPGGVLIYSTCTFATEENERVVEQFLEAHPFEPFPPTEVFGAGKVPRSETRRKSFGLRLWPPGVPGAGHFVARLRRIGDEGTIAPIETQIRTPAKGIEAYETFTDDVYPDGFEGAERVATWADGVYVLPETVPDFGPIRPLRIGMAAGELRKGRFDPAHALAMGVDPARAVRRVDLDAHDEDAGRYLAGETLRREGESGWLVVTVDGFALGWGKRTGSVVKNHYPKGLRRR